MNIWAILDIPIHWYMGMCWKLRSPRNRNESDFTSKSSHLLKCSSLLVDRALGFKHPYLGFSKNRTPHSEKWSVAAKRGFCLNNLRNPQPTDLKADGTDDHCTFGISNKSVYLPRASLSRTWQEALSILPTKTRHCWKVVLECARRGQIAYIAGVLKKWQHSWHSSSFEWEPKKNIELYFTTILVGLWFSSFWGGS